MIVFILIIKVLLINHCCFSDKFDLKELYNDDETANNNKQLPIEVIPALKKLFEYKSTGEIVINGLYEQNTYEVGDGAPEPFKQKRAHRIQELKPQFDEINKQIRQLIQQQRKETKKDKIDEMTQELSKLRYNKIELESEWNLDNGVPRHDIDHRRMRKKTERQPQYWMQYDEESETLYIYFISTQNLYDLKKDFDIDLETINFKGKDIKTHKGFYSVFQKVLVDDLIADLKYIIDLKKNIKHIRICGHSLGGAIAQVLFLGLVDKTCLFKWIEPPSKPDPNVPEARTRLLKRKYELSVNNLNSIQSLLPSKLENYLVITFGAPLLIYWKDIHKIPNNVKHRIINFILPKDPIAMMLGGKYNGDNDPHHFNFIDVVKFAAQKSAIAIGQPLGGYWTIWPSQDQVRTWWKDEKSIGFIGNGFKIKSLTGAYLDGHLGDGYQTLCEAERSAIQNIFVLDIIQLFLNIKTLIKFHGMYKYQSILTLKQLTDQQYDVQLTVNINGANNDANLNALLRLNNNERKAYITKYYNGKTDETSVKELKVIQQWLQQNGINDDNENGNTIFILILLFVTSLSGLLFGAFCGLSFDILHKEMINK